MPAQQTAKQGTNGRADYSKTYVPQAVRRWTGRSFGALEPPTLNSILRDAQRGDMEDFVDLCSYMVRTDAHVRSTVVTRIGAVAGAEVVVEPGIPGPGQTAQQADMAAQDTRDEIARLRDWEDRFSDLLYASMTGVSVLENRWRPEGGMVRSGFGFIHPRDLAFDNSWNVLIRTYADDGVAQWINTADHPGKFVVHTPHNFAERPTLTGELMAIAWVWLFKRWTEKYGLSGFERMANGFLYGKTPRNSPPTVREQLLEDLESLAADGTAVFEELEGGGNPIEILEAANDPGRSAFELIKHWNGEISKGLLGSGLNVEVQDTGGNRALGESQFDTTTLPRLIADGKRALNALETGWLTWWLRYNSGRYGGMPPVPRLYVELVNEEPPQASVGLATLAVQAKAMRKDELRQLVGLPELGPENGGSEFVEIVEQGGGGGAGFSADEEATDLGDQGRPRIEHQRGGEWAVLDADGSLLDVHRTKAEAIEHLRDLLAQPPGGAATPAPFGRRRRTSPRQLSLAFSQTPSRSRTSPFATALSRRSDAPER